MELGREEHSADGPGARTAWKTAFSATVVVCCCCGQHFEEEKDELLAWAKKFKMTTQELEEALSNKMWRKGLIRSRNVV